MHRRKKQRDILRSAEHANRFLLFLSSWPGQSVVTATVLWSYMWERPASCPSSSRALTRMHWGPCSSTLMKWPHASSYPRSACTLSHLADINQSCWAAVEKWGIKHDTGCQSSDHTDRNMHLSCCRTDRGAAQPSASSLPLPKLSVTWLPHLGPSWAACCALKTGNTRGCTESPPDSLLQGSKQSRFKWVLPAAIYLLALLAVTEERSVGIIINLKWSTSFFWVGS